MTHPTNLARILRTGGAAALHLSQAADELDRLFEANEALVARVAVLEEGLSRHLHTEACFAYAARTAREHGNAYCIAICSDSHRALFGYTGG